MTPARYFFAGTGAIVFRSSLAKPSRGSVPVSMQKSPALCWPGS
jgi:hypothetical protein